MNADIFDVTPDSLMSVLAVAEMGADPQAVVESAILVYQQAASEIDRMSLVKDEAKRIITSVMVETGETSYTTRAGKASVSAPSTSVSYDGKALDILIRDDADLAMRLAPYRKITERAGTLRITAAK